MQNKFCDRLSLFANATHWKICFWFSFPTKKIYAYMNHIICLGQHWNTLPSTLSSSLLWERKQNAFNIKQCIFTACMKKWMAVCMRVFLRMLHDSIALAELVTSCVLAEKLTGINYNHNSAKPFRKPSKNLDKFVCLGYGWLKIVLKQLWSYKSFDAILGIT